MSEEATNTWVTETYQEIVGWSSNNLFEPPNCAATNKVARELAALINCYVLDKPFAPYALHVFFLLPKLFFQRTHAKAKTSDNVKALKRRVDLWLNNKIDDLLEEARAIQKRLPRPSRSKEKKEDKARNFADKMR